MSSNVPNQSSSSEEEQFFDAMDVDVEEQLEKKGRRGPVGGKRLARSEIARGGERLSCKLNKAYKQAKEMEGIDNTALEAIAEAKNLVEESIAKNNGKGKTTARKFKFLPFTVFHIKSRRRIKTC